jgi:hypothetical protein
VKIALQRRHEKGGDRRATLCRERDLQREAGRRFRASLMLRFKSRNHALAFPKFYPAIICELPGTILGAIVILANKLEASNCEPV